MGFPAARPRRRGHGRSLPGLAAAGLAAAGLALAGCGSAPGAPPPPPSSSPASAPDTYPAEALTSPSPSATPSPQEYTLAVTDNLYNYGGTGPRGFFYGTNTLTQIASILFQGHHTAAPHPQPSYVP